MADKNYEVGSTQLLDGNEGKVLKKRCYQCRKTSIVSVKEGRRVVSKGCLNNCGPEALAKMFRF